MVGSARILIGLGNLIKIQRSAHGYPPDMLKSTLNMFHFGYLVIKLNKILIGYSMGRFFYMKVMMHISYKKKGNDAYGMILVFYIQTKISELQKITKQI